MQKYQINQDQETKRKFWQCGPNVMQDLQRRAIAEEVDTQEEKKNCKQF